VADYQAGKTKVMGFFVGQLMRKTKGQANPQLANEIFQKLLAEFNMLFLPERRNPHDPLLQHLLG
jgi:hypothetical protein